MDSSVPKRLFLVGCSRSGTTLLQSLLAAHPEIISFPESHFFRYLSPIAKWRERLGLARPSIKEHLEDFYTEICQEDSACVRPGPFTFRMKTYAQAFITTLDNKADAQGASIWLEKTPLHLHYVSLIEHYVPDVQFIHLIRDGRDVIASMHEVSHNHPEIWGGARSVEDCLSRWTSDIERTHRHTKKSQHHVVRYRAVATDTEATLQRLCSALGITYAEDMMEGYKKEAKRISRDFEKWKNKNKNEVSYSHYSKFDKRFNKRKKNKIEKVIEDYDLGDIVSI
jgi:hypothetical protein